MMQRVRYLEVKQLLVLLYCQTMSSVLLKFEGQPIRDHPVLACLVEIKSLLDKVFSSPSDFCVDISTQSFFQLHTNQKNKHYNYQGFLPWMKFQLLEVLCSNFGKLLADIGWALARYENNFSWSRSAKPNS